MIEISVPDGQASASYTLQGVSQAIGTVTVSAMSPRFTDGTRDVDIVQPGFQILNLTTPTTTLPRTHLVLDKTI